MCMYISTYAYIRIKEYRHFPDEPQVPAGLTKSLRTYYMQTTRNSIRDINPLSYLYIIISGGVGEGRWRGEGGARRIHTMHAWFYGQYVLVLRSGMSVLQNESKQRTTVVAKSMRTNNIHLASKLYFFHLYLGVICILYRGILKFKANERHFVQKHDFILFFFIFILNVGFVDIVCGVLFFIELSLLYITQPSISVTHVIYTGL